jgi:hypothetical protein
LSGRYEALIPTADSEETGEQGVFDGDPEGMSSYGDGLPASPDAPAAPADGAPGQSAESIVRVYLEERREELNGQA